eukprot:TRINITY_DN1307_c0_g1_i1.p1 TRINITY_DN1307_c0_g1~~TRINITY_DN1307_c0_g1_i1.p1  ORF type:complete len:762 (-),score=140.47 TRINITY_DN1307_c0_g1_i1:39-2324(-)
METPGVSNPELIRPLTTKKRTEQSVPNPSPKSQFRNEYRSQNSRDPAPVTSTKELIELYNRRNTSADDIPAKLAISEKSISSTKPSKNTPSSPLLSSKTTPSTPTTQMPTSALTSPSTSSSSQKVPATVKIPVQQLLVQHASNPPPATPTKPLPTLPDLAPVVPSTPTQATTPMNPPAFAVPTTPTSGSGTVAPPTPNSNSSSATVEDPIAKKHRMRKERANEVLETEKTYVNSLRIVFESVIEPLKDKAENEKERILRYNQVMDIFSNWETIFTLHKKLLESIVSRMKDWTPDTYIGDIFSENTGWIKLYKHYVNNFDKSIITLETCKKNIPEFSKMMQKVDYSETLCGLNLQAYLILPVQRIPRYVLLIQDLMKYTEPDHKDSELLTKALVIIKEVADYVNANKSNADNITKIHNISSKIIDYPKKEDDLNKSKRVLVREGNIILKKSKLYAFLFNDIILLTKPQGKKYKFKNIVKLNTAMLNTNSPDSFDIMSPAGAFKFAAETPAERDSWIKDIGSSIDGSKNDMISSALTGGTKFEAEGSKKFKQLEEEKNTKKRKDSIQQLIEREREYFSSIQYTKKIFFEPMCELPETIVSARETSEIFMNINLLVELHKSLLDELESRWAENENNTNLQVGNIFMQSLDPLVSHYTEFINNHARSKQVLENCMNYAQFNCFLLELEAREKKGLIELLTQPLKRLATYYLLIQEILQFTPNSHPDYDDLKSLGDTLRQNIEKMEQNNIQARTRLKKPGSMSVMW